MGPIVATHSACRRLTLEQLITRFVLHQAQRALQDRTSANDIELKQFGMSMLLLLTEVCVPRTARLFLHSASRRLVGRSFAQDLPFFVLSTILLIRTLNRKDDAAVLAPNRFCSAEYDTRSFILLFLNTMKTVVMLATKLVNLKSLPSIWSKRLKLQAEKGKLAQRVARLEGAEMATLASAAPADDDASAESPQDAAPADDGSAQLSENRCNVAAGSKVLNSSLDLGSPANALTASDPTMMSKQQVNLQMLACSQPAPGLAAVAEAHRCSHSGFGKEQRTKQTTYIDVDCALDRNLSEVLSRL